MADCNLTSIKSIEILRFTLLYTFALVLGFLLIFTSLDLLVASATPSVVVDLVLPPGQMPPGREKDALTGADGVPYCRRS
jgi:hypothetical protein